MFHLKPQDLKQISKYKFNIYFYDQDVWQDNE